MTGDNPGKILLLVKPAVNLVVTCGLGSGCVLHLSQEIDKAINKKFPYWHTLSIRGITDCM